ARAIGWDAVGVEPSGIGRLGARVLDVPILGSYLEDTSLAPGGFDCIVASEVIEHVPAPRGFIATVSRYLADAGRPLLTTPNGEALRGGAAAEREWYEALSPGQHLNLLSPDALVGLLGEHGLRDVQLFTMGGSSGRKQIVVLAARAPGTLGARLDWDAAC